MHSALRPHTALVTAAPRHVGGADLTLRARDAAIVHLEGPREDRVLAPSLKALSIPTLPPIGRCTGTADARMLGIGPDIWLLVRDEGSAESTANFLDTARSSFEVALDMSAAWTRMIISGAHAATVLAKGCGVDLHPREFPAGTCAATAVARMRTIIWRPEGGARYELVVGRSYALSLWDWLVEAAAEYADIKEERP